jgi:hypothetical protein
MSLPDFASLVRDLLAERGMSQRALAREIPINAGQLSRVLNRERLASEEVASRCDEVFDTGCRLAEAAQRDRATRRLTRKAPTAMAGRHAPQPAAAVATPQPVGHGSNAWHNNGFVTEPLELALYEREVSLDTVHAFEGMVSLLRRLDDEVGPGQLIDAVTAHLTTVIALLSQSASDGHAFTGLSRVAASLSQLSGWLSFDLNRPEVARRHLAVAHQAAIAAADPHLAAYALSWQALIVGQASPRAGLVLALAARRQAGRDVPASVLAWLSRVEAESSAGNGDFNDSHRALDRLAAAAARPRTERDPSWTYFIDDAQIAAYQGVCLVRLGHGLQAEASLRQALDALPAAFVRDRCLYLTYLSAALLLQRQPEAAAFTATQSFGLAVATQSLRSIHRLHTIGRDLAPWQTLPEVQELTDLLISHRYR